MNVLFLTLVSFESIEERNIYSDLLREFVHNGHDVYVVSPIERRVGVDTHIIREEKSTILRLKIGNITKTNLIEKGISTVVLESMYINGIKRHFSNVKFDLILYSTPPITLSGAVEFIRKRDGARTYLLLKDIFPQNAVEIGMLQKTGVKGFLYKYFRWKEKKLYQISDHIGCMSQANLDYVLKHNPEIDPATVEICPNCIEVRDVSITAEQRRDIREKYGIPQDKKVFVYGGNLGRPQGIPFVIDCMKAVKDIEEAFFLIVGSGTEYHLLDEYVKNAQQRNLKLMRSVPKEDYEHLVAACDVGLIFLDHRFTIPNFPSRLLAYMQAGLPVLACTDPNTDIGKVIVDGGFGWWCESNNVAAFEGLISEIINLNNSVPSLKEKSYCAINYLKEHYSVDLGYDRIWR